MLARRDLLNLQRRENRHRQRKARHAVDLDSLAGNSHQSDQAALRLFTDEQRALLDDAVESVASHSTDQERAVLRLLAQGQSSTAEYAAELNLEDLTATEQRQEVKRCRTA
jgi:hypothetical protein